MIPWGTLLQQGVIHQIRHLQMAYLFIYITDITHSITIPLRAYICHSFAKCIIITNPWNTHLWGEWVMNWKLGTSSNKTKKRKIQCFEKTEIESLALLKWEILLWHAHSRLWELIGNLPACLYWSQCSKLVAKSKTVRQLRTIDSHIFLKMVES